MNQKPQIGYRPTKDGKSEWTMNNKPVPYTVARNHWDDCSAEWSMSAYQAMVAVVMSEFS